MRKAILFLVLICSVFADSKWDPIADSKAVIIQGDARFTVLTSALIRIEYSAAGNGKFEDRASLAIVNRKLPVPQFTTKANGAGVIVDTSDLTLTYTGGAFNSNSLQIERKNNGGNKTWTFGATDDDNLLGTLRTLDGADGARELDCKKQGDWSLFCTYGVISRSGWAVVDDTQRNRLVKNDAWEHWVDVAPCADSTDLYFFGHGHNYRRALSEFTMIGGNTPLPPRYVFGVWFSRYWAYSDFELRDVINQYEVHDTPLDVLVTDMDWHITFYKEAAAGKRDPAGETPGWTGYTWDKHLFPNSTAFLEHCKQKGLRNTLNLHPASGTQPYEAQYNPMAIASGIDPATQQYVPFDITNATYAELLHDIMLKPIWKEGIDFWWLDWQQSEQTKIKDLNPTIWLNHVFWKNYERWNLKERPTVFHRWGGLGNHRYQIGFSGDVVPTWKSLEFQPYFTATANNVGYSFWSHDLGGHTEPSPPELYTRWVQWGLFSPVFRPHCTKNANNDRRIWTYPLVNFFIMRDTVNLRSSLVPHIYTLARQTHETGVGAINTPLYYDYPEAEQSYKYKTEFSWGGTVVVSPVTSAVDSNGLAHTDVFLPQGFRWVNWFTGKTYDATNQAQEFSGKYTLPETPAFAKTGAIVSYWPKKQKELFGSAFAAPSAIGFLVFVDGYSSVQSSYRLYEDSGNQIEYENTEHAWTTVNYKQTRNRLSIQVAAPEGTYAGQPQTRNFEFKFANTWAPSAVTVNGNAISFTPDNLNGAQTGWRYEGDELSLVVNVAGVSRANPVQIVVDLPRDLNGDLFSGVRGFIKRAKDGKMSLDYEWGLQTIFQEDYTHLVELSEIGAVLTNNPTSGLNVLSGVQDLISSANKQLLAINYGNQGKAKAVAAQISADAM